MPRSKSPLEQVVNDPAQMPDAEREYYRATWGFDPLGDRVFLGSDACRYESCMPLRQDPPLYQKGVLICARVDWRGDDIHNRIVFRHEQTEEAVECTHLVIHAGVLDDALTFAEDIITHLGVLDEDERDQVARCPARTRTCPPVLAARITESQILPVRVQGQRHRRT